MCCVYPVWKVLGPVGSWRARRSPWGPFNRNHTGGRRFTSAAMWPQNPLWKCENILNATAWYTGHTINQKTLRPTLTDSLLWHKATGLSHSYRVPQNQRPQTRPGSLCDAQCGAHDPAWNRKWAGKARKLVCGDGSFLMPSITTVLRDLLCSVTHSWSMCFQSTGLGFRWWLQIDGPSYPMWEDRKVLYGYNGEE